MKNIRNLWWVGALALLAACDPFTDENKGNPTILSVFGVAGADGSAGDTFPGTVNAAGVWEVPGVTAGPAVFWVKTNKLLDGASIQTTPTSCAPAASANLTVNAAPAPTWFLCYVPATGVGSEGSSVVIYQGVDVDPAGDGYYASASASLAVGTYTITATVADQQGHPLPISIIATVVAAPPVVP